MRKRFFLIVSIMTLLIAIAISSTAGAAQGVVEYNVEIVQSAHDPKEFFLGVPTLTITPQSWKEVVSAGTLGNPEREIIHGPFDWRPGFAGGWFAIIHFEEEPEIVKAEISHLDLMTLTLYKGEGSWISPNLRRVFLPVVTN